MDTLFTQLSLVPRCNLLLFLFFDALNLNFKSPFKKADMSHQATCFPAEELCWEGWVRKVLLKGVFMYVNCTMYCY